MERELWGADLNLNFNSSSSPLLLPPPAPAAAAAAAAAAATASDSAAESIEETSNRCETVSIAIDVRTPETCHPSCRQRPVGRPPPRRCRRYLGLTSILHLPYTRARTSWMTYTYHMTYPGCTYVYIYILDAPAAAAQRTNRLRFLLTACVLLCDAARCDVVAEPCCCPSRCPQALLDPAAATALLWTRSSTRRPGLCPLFQGVGCSGVTPLQSLREC